MGIVVLVFGRFGDVVGVCYVGFFLCEFVVGGREFGYIEWKGLFFF